VLELSLVHYYGQLSQVVGQFSFRTRVSDTSHLTLRVVVAVDVQDVHVYSVFVPFTKNSL